MSVRAEENRNAREFRRCGGYPKRRANMAGKHDDSVEFSCAYKSPNAWIDQTKEFADYRMR